MQPIGLMYNFAHFVRCKIKLYFFIFVYQNCTVRCATNKMQWPKNSIRLTGVTNIFPQKLLSH